MLGLVVVVGVGAFLFLGNDEERSGGGGGGPADDSSSPEAAVEAYFAALESRDCATLIDLSSEATITAGGETRESQLAACEAEIASADAEVPVVTLDDVEVSSETGDSATVTVTATADGSTETSDYPLVLEDGEWKIDFYNMGSSASMEAEPPPASGG